MTAVRRVVGSLRAGARNHIYIEEVIPVQGLPIFAGPLMRVSVEIAAEIDAEGLSLIATIGPDVDAFHAAAVEVARRRKLFIERGKGSQAAHLAALKSVTHDARSGHFG